MSIMVHFQSKLVLQNIPGMIQTMIAVRGLTEPTPKILLLSYFVRGLTLLRLLILVFNLTLVIHIFYPLNLNLLFVILNEVSRIVI